MDPMLYLKTQEELLGCPFCGNQGEISRINAKTRGSHTFELIGVKCPGCHATTECQTYYCWDRGDNIENWIDEAVGKWNQRHSISDKDKLINEMDMEIRRLKNKLRQISQMVEE